MTHPGPQQRETSFADAVDMIGQAAIEGRMSPRLAQLVAEKAISNPAMTYAPYYRHDLASICAPRPQTEAPR